MKRILPILLVLVAIAAFSQASRAALPKNALGAIAVSPDGNTVLAAGDNRVLYVLDAKTLKVTNKVWTGVNPLAIHYSADGTTFVLHDSKEYLRFYDARNFALKSKVVGVYKIAVAEQADILIAAGRVKGRGAAATTPLRGYALATGKPVLDKLVNVAILTLGVDADAKRIFAITQSYKSDTEVKKRAPVGLRGLERGEFVQRNDGKASELVAFDVNGNELGRFKTWYSTTGTSALISLGGKLQVISFGNVHAEFTLGSMDVRMFETKNRINTGIGYSIVLNKLVTGGQHALTVVNLGDGQQKPYRINRLEGWPESFRSFAIASDGTVYGGTSAYRLVRVTPAGRVKSTPVY